MKIEDITIEHFNRSIKNENITIEMWDEEVLLQTNIYFYTENHDISPFIEEIKYRLIRFNQDRNLVLQNIIDEGYLQTAETWAEDCKINVSSTNSKQSKLCVKCTLYIDTRLFGKHAVRRNRPEYVYDEIVKASVS